MVVLIKENRFFFCQRKPIIHTSLVVVGDWGREDGYRTGGYFKDEGDVVGPA